MTDHAQDRPEPDHGTLALADGPSLTVAAVARRLGVAPATLRTWDRRYGLGPSARSAGSHRRYSAEDVARLDLMRRLVNAGAPPGEAARAALAAEVTPEPVLGPGAAAGPVPARPRAGGDPADPAAVDLVDAFPELADLDPHDEPLLVAASAASAVRGLARAAATLDSATCARIVGDSLQHRGVVWTWDNLLVPVLAGIGRQWESSGRGIEVEHLLSETVAAGLGQTAGRLRNPVNPRPVLLAAAEEELHSLPLLAVAAALAERRIGSRVLGARVPHEALLAAVRRTGPAVVLVWSAIARPATADRLAELWSVRPAPLVLAAGPGWDAVPPGVGRMSDLVGTVARISRAVGV